MKMLKFTTLPFIVVGLMLATMPAASARTDDDDWEDRWEDRHEALEEQREEAEERWEEWQEDREEALEELREKGWRHRGRHRHYPPHGGYHLYDHPEVRHHHCYPEPVYRSHDWHGSRVYRYDAPYPRRHSYGAVHAGPVDVYYGRHGSVRVGPIHVSW